MRNTLFGEFNLAGTVMRRVASTYNKLGRYSEALVMKEKSLEFLRRGLPEDHPEIGATGVLMGLGLVFRHSLCAAGECISEFATIHLGLGNHSNAIDWSEKSLNFQRRVLPEDHPGIGDADALRFVSLIMLSRQISATAMNDVAHNYFVDGRHADSFVMRRKALDFRRRVLHQDHIEIGKNYARWSDAW